MRAIVDARLLHYDRAGIGRYLRHLYHAMAEVNAGAGSSSTLQIEMLYHRKDRGRVLRPFWPVEHIAWTPPHHRLERLALASELCRLRPSLVHAPDHVCPQPLGWRTVLTVHDLAFWRRPESYAPESRQYYQGIRRSVRQADRIICVSNATKNDLLELTGVSPSKVRVVYEAPDPAYVVGETPDPADDAAVSTRPYFLFVGTLEPRKNLTGIITSFAQLQKQLDVTGADKRPELLLIGAERKGSPSIKGLPEQLGIAGDVRFLGHLPTPTVAALYRGALALVYPSFLEGFGLPIVEAMASGAPVITANCSSMPEVAGKAAILVDPHDSQALTAAMIRVARDSELRRQMRALGLAQAAKFSWQRAARETLAVFEEALSA
ncbi:MAG TPA: glycosyltransferase family 1 protein [Chloroflexota bacterium]|nr:glycosyltransferase family 1 protein [Chloroflexota bacterium]